MVELSEALKEAWATAPTLDTALHTLEFRHPSAAAPIRIVSDFGTLLHTGDPNDIYGWVLKLEATAPANPSQNVEFLSVMFDFQEPDQEEGSLGQMQISFDNAMQDLSEFLDTAVQYSQPMEVTYRCYLASDPNEPMMVMNGLTVTDVKSTLLKVTASAAFMDFMNNNFPSLIYRLQEFQTLQN